MKRIIAALIRRILGLRKSAASGNLDNRRIAPAVDPDNNPIVPASYVMFDCGQRILIVTVNMN